MQLVNNRAYTESPESDYLAALFKNFNFSDQNFAEAERNAEYAYKHGLIKPKTKHYHENILADAFARYADNPKKYNPGQKNYTQMVTNIGNEVWSDPQIQKWWNESGKNIIIKDLTKINFYIFYIVFIFAL